MSDIKQNKTNKNQEVLNFEDSYRNHSLKSLIVHLFTRNIDIDYVTGVAQKVAEADIEVKKAEAVRKLAEAEKLMAEAEKLRAEAQQLIVQVEDQKKAVESSDNLRIALKRAHTACLKLNEKPHVKIIIDSYEDPDKFNVIYKRNIDHVIFPLEISPEDCWSRIEEYNFIINDKKNKKDNS